MNPEASSNLVGSDTLIQFKCLASHKLKETKSYTRMGWMWKSNSFKKDALP